MKDLQQLPTKNSSSTSKDEHFEPRAQGRILKAEIEDGGSATVTSRFEAYQRDDQHVHRLSLPVTITFFCPNFEPERTKIGDRIWVEFECFADWENLSESTSEKPSIQPLREGKFDIEYSLTGEVFGVTQRGVATGDFYINAVVPIHLTLGLPADPKISESIFEGKIVKLSKGRLYGDVETNGEGH